MTWHNTVKTALQETVHYFTYVNAQFSFNLLPCLFWRICLCPFRHLETESFTLCLGLFHFLLSCLHLALLMEAASLLAGRQLSLYTNTEDIMCIFVCMCKFKWSWKYFERKKRYIEKTVKQLYLYFFYLSILTDWPMYLAERVTWWKSYPILVWGATRLPLLSYSMWVLHI